jgi:protocatechuate 3,4-dioxygenase beta subunit
MKAKSIIFGLFSGLALLQFFPIDKTLPPTEEALELHAVQNPPDEVFSLIKNACYDSDTCDDNENVRCCFVGMPGNLTSEMKIAGNDEPGERLVIRGRVFKADAKTPYAGVIIYAYHTDAKGIYPKKGDETGIRRWHGRLHGWCRTDAEGWFSIHSIRPASYPNSRAAAHIHHVVQEPDGSEPYYINDTVFEDDKFVDDRFREAEKRFGGSSGITKVQRQADNSWAGKRFVTLK